MSERNLKRLLWGLAGALAVFLLSLIRILFGENVPSWAIWGTCLGAVGMLLFWSALLVASLRARASSERPAARPGTPGARVPPANMRRRRQRSRQGPPVGTPVQPVDPDTDSVESDAALFLLAEPDPERAAFRALGRRVTSTGLPPGGLGPDAEAAQALLMAMDEESRVSAVANQGNDWLRRVKGANCKGRLCWICGREHGPEIAHNSRAPWNGLIAVDVAQRLGWLEGADHGQRGAPPG